MGKPLGPTQRLVLLALYPDDDGDGAVDFDDRPVLTPAEIAEYIAKQMELAHGQRRPTSEAEAANASLRTLERRGYVQRRGKAQNGSRCWSITDAGRAAIEEQTHA